MSIFADRITEILTMQEVIERYHHIGRAGRTSCPFHEGKDNNLSYNNKVFQCFVCGAKGNVISFVMQLFNLNFGQAVSRIDYDFNLRLPLNEKMTYHQRKDIMLQNRKRKEQQQQKQAQQDIEDKDYWKIFDEWKRLDDNMRDYKPKSSEDVVHSLFIEAITKINYQSYLLDIAQAERRKNG